MDQLNISRRQLIKNALATGIAAAAGYSAFAKAATGAQTRAAALTGGKIVHTDAEWRKILTSDQYTILRQAGTEPAYHNAYWNNHVKGDYLCAGCNQLLFHSSTKFDSGTGWPSFWAPATKTAVVTHDDSSFGMDRTEVRCARCEGHLGHVFDDGPKPTGLRYCMNSGAMKFVPAR